MSGTITVIAQLHTSGTESRQKIINALDKVSRFSKEHEPGVVRYAILIPRDSGDDKSLYVIEEYTTQAALDKHMATTALAELLETFKANPDLVTGPPDVYMTETSSSFKRPEIVSAKDPFVCFATIVYQEGKRDEAMEGWKVVAAETEKNEPKTLSYTIVKDKDNSQNMRSVEVYSNEKYFKEVHATSQAVANNRAKYGDQIRISIKHVFLTYAAGYLHVQRSASNL